MLCTFSLSCPFQSQGTGAQCGIFSGQLAHTHAKANAMEIQKRQEDGSIVKGPKELLANKHML